MKPIISMFLIGGVCVTALFSIGCSSATVNSLVVSTQSSSNHIRALFFGTGPYHSPSNVGRPGADDRWSSFPPGSTLTMLVSADVSEADMNFLRSEITSLNDALDGFFTIDVVRSDQGGLLRAQHHEITVSLATPEQMRDVCPGGPGGCMEFPVAGPEDYIFDRVESYYPSADGIFDMHEIGHAIGLCHVLQSQFNEGTMASEGGSRIANFSQSELNAIRIVFGSGLTLGARERDFRDAGLLP